jgi:hypothetical protein
VKFIASPAEQRELFTELDIVEDNQLDSGEFYTAIQFYSSLSEIRDTTLESSVLPGSPQYVFLYIFYRCLLFCAIDGRHLLPGCQFMGYCADGSVYSYSRRNGEESPFDRSEPSRLMQTTPSTFSTGSLLDTASLANSLK